MKTFALLCLIPLQLFCSQQHEDRFEAIVYWVNDCLYIECDDHLYCTINVQHSINCDCDLDKDSFIPPKSSCCKDCVESIQEKIDTTSTEIIREHNRDECDLLFFNYLLGKYEAYWECLHLIQHQGS